MKYIGVVTRISNYENFMDKTSTIPALSRYIALAE